MRSYRDSLQYKIATGRGTLPVAILLSLALWGGTAYDWKNVGALVSCTFIAYLLIEFNTQFSLIRTRTTLPTSLYLLFYSSLPFLHACGTAAAISPLFLLLLFFLFKSYESPRAPVAVFHTFLCLGCIALLDAYFLYLAPLIYGCMFYLRTFSIRTFFAGLLGSGLPFWLLIGYGAYQQDLSFLIEIVRSLADLRPIDYTHLAFNQFVSWAVITLIGLVTGLHTLRASYKEKVQTRVMLHLLIVMEAGVNLLLLLQPHHFNHLMSVLMVITSLPAGYMFSLTFTRYTRLLTVAVLVTWILLCLLNLWMHFYHF